MNNGVTDDRPVGIIAGMEIESTLLKDSMEIEAEETLAGLTFYRGRLSGRPAVLVRCGMGKVTAAVCAQTMILHFGVSCIINTGVAGAVNSELNIGSIVISKDAVQHDMDLTALGYQKSVFYGNVQSVFPADEELRRRAAASAKAVVPQGRVYEGRVCSGDQFIADSMKKRCIFEEHGAMCCEMVGAAIGQVCTMNAVPFVIICAISDKADDVGHISFRGFSEAAARHSVAIVRHMIENA